MSDAGKQEDYSWIDNKWEEVADQVANGMRMNSEEKALLKKAPVAKVVGMLPIIAKCKQSNRIACSHLSTLILAHRIKGPFLTDEKDVRKIKNRLYAINRFKNGDKKTLKAGINFLVRAALEDAYIDREKDKKAGKYNPINKGHWEYESMKNRLDKKLSENSIPELNYLLKNVNFQDGDYEDNQFWLPD